MFALKNRHTDDRFILTKSKQKTHLQPYHSQPPPSQNTYHQIIRSLFKEQITPSQSETSSNTIAELHKTLSQKTECQSNTSHIGKKQDFKSPVKVLDLPHLRNDFYLNLIDWSKRGPIVIALDYQAYLYTPEYSFVVAKAPVATHITSLKIEHTILFVGLSNGSTQIHDLERIAMVRSLSPHTDRVGSLCLMNSTLLTGSKDKTIIAHDFRLKSSKCGSKSQHKGQVCALTNKDSYCFASGSNDNSVLVWDIRSPFIEETNSSGIKLKVTHRLKSHAGAVKALQWCPWRNGLLASGGGNGDKTIKLWNTNQDTSGNNVESYQTQGQVSGLVWNNNLDALLSAHGYSSNHLVVWNYDPNRQHYDNAFSQNGFESDKNKKNCSLLAEAKWKAHESRVLDLCQSADESAICTVGAEEILKVWELKEGSPWGIEEEKRASGMRLL